MLPRPDVRVLEALLSLRNSNEWQRVREWLEEGQSKIQRRGMLETSEVHMRWNQGALQTIGDLLQWQDQARESLDKIKNSESR